MTGVRVTMCSSSLQQGEFSIDINHYTTGCTNGYNYQVQLFPVFQIGIVIFWSWFPSARPKELLRKEKVWLTDVAHNSWWHMKRAQHAVHNPKFRKDGIIQTSPVVAIIRLKDPPTWLKGATMLEKTPTPTHTVPVDVLVPSSVKQSAGTVLATKL